MKRDYLFHLEVSMGNWHSECIAIGQWTTIIQANDHMQFSSVSVTRKLVVNEIYLCADEVVTSQQKWLQLWIVGQNELIKGGFDNNDWHIDMIHKKCVVERDYSLP